MKHRINDQIVMLVLSALPEHEIEGFKRMYIVSIVLILFLYEAFSAIA